MAAVGCVQCNMFVGCLMYRVYYVDFGRVIIIDDVCVDVFEGFDFLQLMFYQVRQFQIFKQKVEEFILVNLKYEFVYVFD